jgi:hypothetical protein
VLKITDFTQKVIAAPRPATLLFRDSLLPFLTGMKAFQKRAGKTISEIAIEYRNSSIVENHRLAKGPHAGDRAPSVEGLQDPKGRKVSLLSIFGKHHVLLVVPGKKDEVDDRSIFEQPIQSVRKRHGYLVRPYLVVENNELAGQFEIAYLIDSERQFAAMYGDTPAFYLVRPDGYIAFRCRAVHSNSLLAYLQKLFCTS